MKNAAFRLVHNVGIAVHNTKAPSAEEWELYLAMTAAAIEGASTDLSKFKQLVVTDGGGPNAAQRKASMALGGSRTDMSDIKVAVLSSSIGVRGIVTAFNWMGAPLRSFSPEHVREAFAYLAIGPNEAPGVCMAVESLCASIDGEVVSAAGIASHRRALGG